MVEPIINKCRLCDSDVISTTGKKKTFCGDYRIPGTCAYLHARENKKNNREKYKQNKKKTVTSTDIAMRYLMIIIYYH